METIRKDEREKFIKRQQQKKAREEVGLQLITSNFNVAIIIMIIILVSKSERV